MGKNMMMNGKLKLWWLPHYGVYKSRHKVVHIEAMTNQDSMCQKTEMSLCQQGHYRSQNYGFR